MANVTRRWFVTRGVPVVAGAAADLDAARAQRYGHVSARHDRDPSRYLMSRSLASELVTAGTLGRPWELWKRKAVARQEEP